MVQLEGTTRGLAAVAVRQKQTWFTSDPHWGHKNVLTYSQRPFIDLDSMHFALVYCWNAAVKPEDTIYILGDMFLCNFAMAAAYAQNLQGRKILIRGNHDKFSKTQYEKLGFHAVLEEAVILLGPYSVRLSHYPYEDKFEKDPRQLRYLDRRPECHNQNALLHGHVHELYKVRKHPLQINVGVDQWGFAPVNQREIERVIQSETKLV